MTHQFLYGANIVAIFEQMGGKAVAKCMATRTFIDPCAPNGLLNGILKTFGMNVVSSHDP